MTLRARRDIQTRKEIYDAAATLFLKQGFSKTSVAQVAEASGVSRRTVYRHFPTKEKIAYEIPRKWLDVYKDVIANRDATESPFDVCHRGILEVARCIQADRARISVAFQVMATMPSLPPTHAALNREWLLTHRSLLVESVDPNDEAGVLACGVMAGAILGGTDLAFAQWLEGPDVDLVELTEQVWEMANAIYVR